MNDGFNIDREAVAQACRAHGVRTLQIFGSATSTRFDPAHSDVDFLVEFFPGSTDPFDDYFGLKEDLERIVARDVDLVMVAAVRNPFFARSAAETAEQLYAA
jgi:predicted nucleotidyltransferase